MGLLRSKIKNSFFLKASIGTLLATLTRMICRFVINKIYAVLLGPAGIALIGQFQDLIATSQTFTGAGIKDGITKFLASNTDEKERIDFLSSSLKLLFLIASFAGFVFVVFSKKIVVQLFDNKIDSDIILFLAFSLFIINMIPFYQGVCNGLKNIKSFSILEVLNGFVSLLLAAISTYLWGITGALFSIVLSQITLVFIFSFLFRRNVSFRQIFFNKTFNYNHLLKHKKFIAIAIISGCLMPIIQIAIRNQIITHMGVVDAGYWDAMKRLGNLYFPIFVSFGSVYFFPRFSEIIDKQILIKEIKQKLLIIVGVLSLGFIILFLCKELVVTIIFSEEFIPITDLFIPFFIGDIFNVMSLVFLTLMISREKIKEVIICRIIVGLTRYIGVLIFIDKLGLTGVVYSYAISYMINFIYGIYFFYREVVRR